MNRGTLKALDGLVALWCTLWICVGAWTGYEVWQLGALSDTVAESGYAIDEAGQALQSLGKLPVVGETTGSLGDQIRENAAEIVESAGEAETSIRRLGVLLGLLAAVVPTVPLLAVYLPIRTGRVSLNPRRDPGPSKT